MLSSFERMIFRRLFVCLSLCLSVGTYVGGECGESAETAGVVASWGRPSSQRNSRMAQHAELDLQAPSPVLPPKGLLQEEPAKIGAALNITSWFTEITVSPLFILFYFIHHFSADPLEWRKNDSHFKLYILLAFYAFQTLLIFLSSFPSCCWCVLELHWRMSWQVSCSGYNKKRNHKVEPITDKSLTKTLKK